MATNYFCTTDVEIHDWLNEYIKLKKKKKDPADQVIS